MDNLSQKNIKWLGLKEGVQGDNLVTYLEDLFSACLGADSNISSQIVKAYRIGPSRTTNKYFRDVLVQFANWEIRYKVYFEVLQV